MKAKVHPHKTRVDSGVEACVSVTPDKKHGRAYYMGTVFLSDVNFRVHESGVKRMQKEQVKNVHAWAVGEVIHESVEQYRPTLVDSMVKVSYDEAGHFVTAKGEDVTDKTFKAAVIVGKDLFVSTR